MGCRHQEAVVRSLETSFFVSETALYVTGKSTSLLAGAKYMCKDIMHVMIPKKSCNSMRKYLSISLEKQNNNNNSSSSSSNNNNNKFMKELYKGGLQYYVPEIHMSIPSHIIRGLRIWISIPKIGWYTFQVATPVVVHQPSTVSNCPFIHLETNLPFTCI